MKKFNSPNSINQFFIWIDGELKCPCRIGGPLTTVWLGSSLYSYLSPSGCFYCGVVGGKCHRWYVGASDDGKDSCRLSSNDMEYFSAVCGSAENYANSSGTFARTRSLYLQVLFRRVFHSVLTNKHPASERDRWWEPFSWPGSAGHESTPDGQLVMLTSRKLCFT